MFGLTGPNSGGSKGQSGSVRLSVPLEMAQVEREVEFKFGDSDLSMVDGSLGFMGLTNRSPFGKGTRVPLPFADLQDFKKIVKQSKQADQQLKFCVTFESARALLQASRDARKKSKPPAGKKLLRTGLTQGSGRSRLDVRILFCFAFFYIFFLLSFFVHSFLFLSALDFVGTVGRRPRREWRRR